MLRGFLRNPLVAFERVSQVTIEMKSLYNFKLHIHGADFLRDLVDASSQLGMKPFLMWGTLLGQVREGRFLEHDYDIDLGMLDDDYAKKDELIRAMKKRGYKVRHDVPYSLSFVTADGLLYLDIDRIYKHKGKMIQSARSELSGEITAYHYPDHVFNEFVSKIFVAGIRVWVPTRAEDLLESIYGDWRTPAKDYNYMTGPRNAITDQDFLKTLR